jgi:hypothetical protein
MTVSTEASAAARVPLGRIPDFFIVGHAKCGTTALYEGLRQHPGVYMADYKGGMGKEPMFFARHYPRAQSSTQDALGYTGRRAMTMADYMSLFAGAAPGQRVGEASTSYLWSPVAAQGIAEVQPAARIIALLREPASFLRSVHLQHLQNNDENVKDFRKAFALDAARREGRHIPPRSYWPAAIIYSDRVRYVEQLRRYHAVFPREQVLVLIYDDFRDNNEATVREVLRFLEVDDSVPIQLTLANPTIGVRSTRLNDLKRALREGRSPMLRAVRDTGKALTSTAVRKTFYYPIQRRLVFQAPPPPDEEFMLELRRRFKGEVVALSEYLNRDLVTLWGYDRLD